MAPISLTLSDREGHFSFLKRSLIP